MKALRYRESTVLAPDGRPVYVAEPAYRSAGSGRRFAGFPATRLGPNAALLPNLDVLKARVRSLAKNVPYVRKGLRSRVANVVGCGIVPQSLAPEREQRRELEQWWFDWVDDADVDGWSFYASQMVAVWEMFLAGECFLRLRPRFASDEGVIPGLPLAVPLQVQIIAGEHCPVSENRILRGGNRVRAGIEFDANIPNRRTAYYLYRQHPDDGVPFSGPRDTELVRVPASQVIHLFERTEPGQLRGVPGGATGLLRAHDKEAFDDATLQRLVVSSLLAIFVTSPDAQKGPLDDEEEEDGEVLWSPARVTKLLPGEDIRTPDLPDVGAGYADYHREVNRQLAASWDTTYEQFTGDLSDVDYSSIRAGLVEFRRHARMLIHSVISPIMNRRVWVEFIRAGLEAGRLKTIDPRAFKKNPLPFLRVEWVPEGWEWVDPQKEITAAKEAVRGGFRTRSSVVREQGYNPAQVLEERKAELSDAHGAGVQFDTDVPNPDRTTAASVPADQTTTSENQQTAERQRRRRRARSAAHA